MAASSSTNGAAPAAWRQFSFFDVQEVKDASDLAEGPSALRSLPPPILVIPTSPRSPLNASVILSDATGHISLLNRKFEVERSWKAWEGNGRSVAIMEGGGILVTIGEEEESRFPVLKIWDLVKDDRKLKRPVLMRSLKIQHGQRPHPVSSMAMTTSLSHLAIGLGDGTVLLYRHLSQSLTTSPLSLISIPKPRVVHESPEPITGLGFREPLRNATPGEKEPLSLFVVTTNRVLCAQVGGKGSGGDCRTVDEIGGGLGCATMDWDRREMIVARDEAVYLYGPEGRGACYAYEGPKSSIHTYKHNLIIVSPPFLPSAGSNSATVRNYVARAPANGASTDVAKVTVFDLQNKLVSHSSTFREGVRDIVCQWGTIFVYGGDSKLTKLEEHPTAAKLEVFYRRSLFVLAIGMAKSQGVDEAGLADIHRRYGDHLYIKGDFDGAMAQFVKTLGHLQPSYVIRKFLDAQRIHNLTTYLQELHARGLANPDHTTLLINCYTKTSDRARLDSFIKSEAISAGDVDSLPFDLDTAIRVCRQAGFYEHAVYLAKKFGRHEEFLRIQIEDAEDFADALSYLRGLGPAAAQDNLVRYGRSMLQREPKATTQLLIELCSGSLGRVPRQPIEGLPSKAESQGGAAYLSYLGYNRITNVFSDSAERPASSPTTAVSAAEARDSVVSRSSTLDAGPPAYDPPSPRLYFAHFVDHPKEFIDFLEAVAAIRWGQSVGGEGGEVTAADEEEEADQRAVWNTLLELYLTSSASEEIKSSKALGLLNATPRIPLDLMHALILCSTNGFTEGLVCLWEKMGMYDDVLRYYMELSSPGASSQVVHYLRLYGPTNHELYPLVLRYLTSSTDLLADHTDDLTEILQVIDEEHIMPPLAVVQLLGRNGVASVGIVKEWLKAKVAETTQDVESASVQRFPDLSDKQDKQLVQSYRSETAAKQKEMTELMSPRDPQVFQVTRCAFCGNNLDLPAVHFMCKHSYHQRCLADSEPECHLCARQHSVVREIRRNQDALKDRHDLFLQEVQEADDGFAVVAGAFGRGMFQSHTAV